MSSFIASGDEVGFRLDSFLSERLEGVSRSAIQKQIEGGTIQVNGLAVPKNYKLRLGDTIEVQPVKVTLLSAEAQDIPVNIVYEDDCLVVVNKPKGMVVHPANGNPDGTLVNALMYHCKNLSGINGVIRPGIVHRIDKDTSGLLIVAKNDMAHVSLAEQIKAHSFLREYQAVVYGSVKADDGVIDLPIGRHPVERKRMCVTDRNARNAVTHYTVIARYDGFTHVKLRLETGRTHQIRVHMAYMGYPVAGDAVYGPKRVIKRLDGQCLHAKTIGFVHPATGEQAFFDSELPEYFTDFLATLKGGSI